MSIKYPALLALICAPMAYADVFINEIHYDNISTDTGEAIEVAGPAGTDLSGWSLILYNGNNSAAYNTTSLSGVIPDQQGGMGTIIVNYPSNGLQNGGSDGIALFDGTQVIQFLSYEGTLIAVGGVADGMESTDIGVSESNSTTLVGHSLQLSGSGTVYSDFVWNNPAANTYGAVNSGQTFGDGEEGGDTGLEGVCFNCPDLDKVADATTFNDSEYYASAIAEVDAGSNAAVIKGQLTSIISTGHRVLTYNQVWTALTETDEDPLNSDNVTLLYKGTSLPKLSNGSGEQSQNLDNWNREHVWPNSKGFPDDGPRDQLPSFEAFTDIHHLRPTDISVNGSRGNLDFDNSDAPLAEAPSNRVDGDSFEPRDLVKGDVARMMFYMDTRYEGLIDNTPDLMLVDNLTTSGQPQLGRLCRLLEWHVGDPVDAIEQERNASIYEYQGNRNPFIDHPEWVSMLFTADACEDTGGDDGDNGNVGTVEANALMITEIMQNPSTISDTNGEWFEVLNTSTQVVNLNGWTIRDNDSDSFTIEQDVFIGIGQYAVLGKNGDVNANGGVVQVYSYGSQMALANGSDELVLVDPDGNIVDEITYDNGATFPDPNGASMTLIDLYGDNNIGSKWAADTTNFYDANNSGTPGTGDASFNLVITEIMQNPRAVSDSSGEYFEVLNTGVIAANMNGWTIRDNDSDSHTITEDVYVPAGTYAVFTNNSDITSNGGFEALYQYSGMFIGNGSDEIVLERPDTSIEDIVEYDNGATFPDPNGASMTLTSAALDNNVGANWFAENAATYGDGDFGTPGSGPDGKTFGGGNDGGGEDVVLGQCSDPATLISAIQGAGDASPMESQDVIVEAVVTASYSGLGGFFLQEESSDVDADAATSEGVFVNYTAGSELPAANSVVRVLGSVKENFGRTQLDVADAALDCGVDNVEAVALTLPFDSAEQAESLEGMLVFNQNALTVTDNFNLGRFGEVTLSSERLFTPTNQHAPLSAEAIAQAEFNELNRVVMDDGLTVQNPENVAYPTGGLSANNTLRSGDLVTSVTAPLDYSFSRYRLHPIQPPTFVAANNRESTPSLNRGNITVASLNVLNLFNGDGLGGGFPTSRGADTAEEFERQIAKTVAAIAAMDADIIGLMEIENDGFDAQSMVVELANRLNAVAGEGTYANVASIGPIGTDAIAVGLLYKPASVSLVDDVQLNFDEIFNRPPMAQTFAAQNGAELTVVVNHFKSKGCGGSSGDNADQGDGQGCYNALRVQQSQALTAWLASDEQLSTKENVLIIGDLNAYAKEDPITALENVGFVNLVETFQGEDAYSYTFRGEFGYLDHALASTALLEQTVDAIEWHINADEPRVLDYNVEFKSDAQVNDFYAPDAFRISDHDPVLISFDLAAPPVFGDMDGDQDVDYADMRALINLIRARNTSVDLHDFNNDGVVNTRDVSALRRLCTRSRCAM